MAAHERSPKKRPYRLKKRAELQSETRRRIAEAAVELHSTVGPGRTTVTMIADRAGVQRHTFYAHFPDEEELFHACSVLSLERDPMPDAARWESIEGPEEKLREGLSSLYDWFERNEQLAGCVLRDAEYHVMTRKTAERAFGPSFAAYREVLGGQLGENSRAALQLALSYFTWRTLVREAGLDRDAAVDLMIAAITGDKSR